MNVNPLLGKGVDVSDLRIPVGYDGDAETLLGGILDIEIDPETRQKKMREVAWRLSDKVTEGYLTLFGGGGVIEGARTFFHLGGRATENHAPSVSTN